MARSRVRRSVLLGVVGSLLFAGGLVLGGAATLANLPQTERLAIGARVTVEAYHSDGDLYSRWEGHNALTSEARKAIVGCVSGLDATPNQGPPPLDWPPTTGCTSLTHLLRISDSAGGLRLTKAATKSLSPAGCITDVSQFGTSAACTGWKLEATFDGEITQAASIDGVAAVTENGGGQKTVPFTGQVLTAEAPEFNQISISPAIAVTPGDRLIITLNFDVP